MGQLPVKLQGNAKGIKFDKDAINAIGEGINFKNLLQLASNVTTDEISNILKEQEISITNGVFESLMKQVSEGQKSKLDLVSDVETEEVIQIDTDEIKEELVNLDGLIDSRVFTDIKIKNTEANKITSEEDVLKIVNEKPGELVRIAEETLKEIERKQQGNKEVKTEIDKIIKEKIEVIQNDTKLKVDTKENVVIENNTINKNNKTEIEVKPIELKSEEFKSEEVKVETEDAEIELKDLVTSENKIIKISDESSEIKSSVVNQVKEKIEFTVKGTDKGFEGVKEVKMKLNPESLGEVDIKIEFEEGKIKVEIITQNDETKKLVESSSSELTKILGKLDEKNVTVTVNSYNKTAESNNSGEGHQGKGHQNQQQQNNEQNREENIDDEIFFQMLRLKNKTLFNI